ncbi:MAG TPA: putative quinol monooxygenase [Burkholderiales bacterium]
MVHVIAVITAKPGKREELLGHFRANVAAVRAEQGCIEYGAAVDAPESQAKYGPDTIVIIEKWQSMEALQAHGRAPHMATWRANTKDLLAERAVHILSPA